MTVHKMLTLQKEIVYFPCCGVFQIWPDFAVKKDIDNLKVKCDNCTVGCDWNGLFKQLMVCVLPSYNELSSTLHFIATLTRVSVCRCGV